MTTRDEAINIATDDQRVAGTLVKPGTLVPGVLFVHGWGGSQEKYLARARQIAALGCVCLTFNLRGHAETEPQHETVTREAAWHAAWFLLRVACHGAQQSPVRRGLLAPYSRRSDRARPGQSEPAQG